MIETSNLLSGRSGRVVATARAILALSLLLAISIGTTGPARIQAAHLLITGYTAYAVLMALAIRRRELVYRLLPWSLTLHIFDFAIATALLYLTSGADSPFFSPLVFLVVAATIHWGSRGAVLTGAAVAVVFVPSGVAALSGADPDHAAMLQFVVRLGYLATVTSLLANFGSHIERVIKELERLSLPLREPLGDAEPPVRACLDHAMGVFRAERGALVWIDPEEGRARLLQYNRDEGFVLDQIDLGDEPPVLVDPEDAALAVTTSGTSFVRRGARVMRGPVNPLSPALAQALRFERALIIRASAESFDGWAFVFDHADPASEDLAISAMVSAQISIALERWRAHQVRREAVAGQERIRLARDLHDGVLQFLAGASLQLDALGRERDSAARQTRLGTLRAALADEQRELRGFIAAMNPTRSRRAEIGRPLVDELGDLADRLARHWSIEVTSSVEPATLSLPPNLLFDMTRFVREGVANAVRLGAASSVRLSAREDGAWLTVNIWDDGRGFPFVGSRDHDELAGGGGPRSLHERARALGGRLSLESSEAGARVILSIPVDAK